MSYKMQELLTIREYLGSSPVFGGIRVAHLFSYLCCVFVICLSLSCVSCTQCCQCLWIIYSWFPLRFSLAFIYEPKPALLVNNAVMQKAFMFNGKHI